MKKYYGQYRIKFMLTFKLINKQWKISVSNPLENI